jgi:hypothetical protein
MPIKSFVSVLLALALPFFSVAQQKQNWMEGTADPDDADRSYIRKFVKTNDARGFFKVQNTRVEFGSTKEGSKLNRRGYFKNSTNQVGLGLSYKIFGAEISFSLPQQKLVDSSLQNLKQFRLGFSFTGRKFAGRVYLNNSKGLVVSDALKRFQSEPDVKMFKTGAQMIYIFNDPEYSLKAAVLQTEIQRRTAGSVLIKGELFFHSINTGSGLVIADRDLISVYGDQAGLNYARGPGLLIMPGYGMNFSFFDGQLYVAPMAFLGAGASYNFYRGKLGSHSKTNLLIGGMSQLNFGYNSPVMYTNFSISGETTSIKLNPSFITSTDFRFNITLGFRFGHLEDVIPTTIPDNIF